MTANVAYVPAPRTEFVELARTASGKLFKKQLLKFGSFAHPNIPGEKLVIDRTLADTLVRNFKDGVCDIVQVPVCDEKNTHVEDPFRNIGEVIDLAVDEDGVYATIDVRKSADEVGKTLLGVSAMMHLNYTDTRTGEKVGPTLLHAAVTNRPYITNLAPFEEIIAASAIGDDVPVMFREDDEEISMTKDELIQRLRDEHGIDVDELQTRGTSTAGVDELVSAMSRVLAEAGVVKMSQADDEEVITVKDVAEAVIELSQEKLALEDRVAGLVAEANIRYEQATELEVDSLVQAGRILPAQREVMLRLARTDRDTFYELVPESSIVSLSEDGVTVHEMPANSKFEEEIARLSAKADELSGGKK